MNIFRRLTGRSKPAQTTPSGLLAGPDLDLLNDAGLEYIRALSSEEIARRVDEVAVEGLDDAGDVARAGAILEREGIVIVRNFVSRSSLTVASDALVRIGAALDQATASANFETPEIVVQSHTQIAESYAALAAHPKAVATIRKGADEGMVDLFNFDRLVGSDRAAFRAPFEGEQLMQLMKATDTGLTAQNLNLYLNRSITKTRGFHVDTFRRSLKGFVYLGDVMTLGTGPYCYVRRSHQDGPWRRANQQISALTSVGTEAPFVDHAMIVPCLAPAGSLILSDQAGVHRGFPQATGAERRVVVMRYK